jgi:NAD(P)-dependent dehydrogenase (short-subunit alcohol dehydrogenase family)
MPFDATTTTDEVLDGVDLSGRTAVVTGASGGLGLETARSLASHGATVVIAARDRAKCDAAAASIQEQVPGAEVDVVLVDLSSLGSVRAAAAEVAQRHPRVDLLVDNAGVMACPLARTADGFEMQFGTNHLGHFLFTVLLADQLVAAAPSRVVVLSSAGHRQGGIRWDDPNYAREDEYFNWDAYGQAKTANALFALELDRRLAPRGVHAFSVHPGVIMTDLARHMTKDDFDWMASRAPSGGDFRFKSVEQGAATSVWAATAPELDAHGGAYLEDCSVAEPTEDPDAPSGVRPWARDPEAAARLWALSEELVGPVPAR